MLALHPPAEFPAGTASALTAVSLGLGNGDGFALVAQLVEPPRMGTVTGLAGAAGGLDGSFTPLLADVVYQATGAYTPGCVLLALIALAVGPYSVRAFRS